MSSLPRLLGYLLLLVLGALPASAAEAPVQLLYESRQIAPRSSFEVRFATEMIAPEQLTAHSAQSPLIFTPALEGHFTWLSTRSGSFTPSLLPPLGTSYKISLRPGLKDANGNELKVSLEENVYTPPMRIKGIYQDGRNEPEDASALPEIWVLFNTPVQVGKLAKYISLTSEEGTRVPVRIHQIEGENAFRSWASDDHSLLIWGETSPAPSEEPEEAPERVLPRKNVLKIEPTTPLPIGTKWKLTLSKGLPSSDGKAQLAKSTEFLIGSVKPFEVSQLSAETGRHSGRLISVRFSKDLAESVKPENLSRWINLSPQPAGFKAEVEGETVTLRGDFELGKDYAVSIAAGIAASEPFSLREAVLRTLRFEPIAPRLYFEDFDTHQQLNGTRHFRLSVINVPKLQVTATLFKDAAEVARALNAYQKYLDPNDEKMPEGESYARLDPAAIGGKAIWKKEFSTVSAADEPQLVNLDWNEILGDKKGGAVLLTAESSDALGKSGKRCGTQALVQVTDLGAIWKRADKSTFVHVFSLAGGKARAGATVRLLDAKQNLLGQTTSDEKGDAILPAINRDKARWLWVEQGADTHLISLIGYQSEIPLYRMGIEDYGYSMSGREAESVFLLSERGVYQPGDTLHLKGIARDFTRGERAELPAGRKLILTVSDPSRREVFRKEISLSEFGSFSEDVVLPKEALGQYQAKVEGLKKEDAPLNGSLWFEVQQYRPNAFEVLVAEPPALLGSAPVSVPVAGRYLMGKTLSNSRLRWSLVARDIAFEPAGFSEFIFCDGINDYRLNRALDRLSQFNSQGEADLKADGTATVASDLPINPRAPQPRAAKLLCEVTDLNQDTVCEARDFTRHASEFYFGLRRIKPLIKQGEALPVELIAVRATDAQPLEKPIRASLRLTRIDWQTNRMAGAGDASEFESKPVFAPVWSGEIESVPFSKERSAAPPLANGPVPREPGLYLLEARGKDGGGREVLTSLTFYVAGKGQTVWDYDNPYVINLVADKTSYEPGQTAQILIKTPIEGEASVTVERAGVRRSFITQLSGNAPSISVPLLDGDAPNVFVSVIILRGADQSPRKIKAPDYRAGYCQLKVTRPGDKLSVSVSAARPNYLPAENVEVEAAVSDSSGKPLADAEVILYAVDEGVLSLTGYKTPDPLAFFNKPRQLNVATSLTLPTLLNEEVSQADFSNKGYLIGDGKGGSGANNGLRKKFVACAFWNATLRTDAQGHVKASFAAPDGLTRYRIMAVAHSRSSQFGAGESVFEINKPFMVEPALPRFANIGDKLTLRAVLHNTSQMAGKAEVSLELDNLAKASGAAVRSVSVPAGASVALDFPVEFIDSGRAIWRWKATLTSTDGKATLRDAVQSELNVGYPAPLLREVHTGRVEAEEAELLTLNDPQILESRKAQVQVRLTNTRALELGEALRQVLGYPYGCVEQTTSALLPWLFLSDLKGALPQMDRPKNEVADAVNHGITQIFSMQTGMGGLGYWPGASKPMVWGSAYGALGLALAQRQGFAVPAEAFKRLLNYLGHELRGAAEDGNQFSERCLALYALAVAGKPEPAYHELIFKKRAFLSGEDRAVLALAMIESRGPRAMIDELLADKPEEGSYVETWFGSEARLNALQLMAWTLHDPKSPRVDELATALFRGRTHGHWITTQGNAWALMALGNYLKIVERGSGDQTVSGDIRWAARKETFALSKSARLFEKTFAMEPASARAPLQLTRTAGERVFSEVTVEAQPPLAARPAQDRGFAIERRYSRVADDGTLKPARDLHVGDRVLVSLSIEVRRRSTFVAVEDPLPAVFAPLNPAFKTQQSVAGERGAANWMSDHAELREDRAVFFADELRPGRYTLRYLARVVAEGIATAPAAKIEEMYHPERFGNSGTLQVETRPLKK